MYDALGYAASICGQKRNPIVVPVLKALLAVGFRAGYHPKSVRKRTVGVRY